MCLSIFLPAGGAGWCRWIEGAFPLPPRLTAVAIVTAVCLASVPGWPIGAGAALPAATVAAPDSGVAFVLVAGDTLWLTPRVEVVGSRVPAALPGLVRAVCLLEVDEWDRLPGRSPAELLAAAPGVAVNQRQQYGVQADLSIRGSTFEQVQVLLDGIDIGDPQTGHHLLNLPLGLQDIARLEVLRGHGSALYGANACGGTVNVISRRPSATGAHLAVTGGGNNTWGARGSYDWVGGDGLSGPNARISAERFRTDGFRSGSDADNWTATGRLGTQTAGGEGDLFLGFARRSFGARDFYAPTDSWERTTSAFGAARWRRRLSRRMTVEPRLHFRHHEDRFILFRHNPDRYTNDHLTRRGGAELRSVVEAGHGLALALGVEAVYEDIHSTGVRGSREGPALGDHARRRAALALELARHAAPLRWQVGLRLDARSEYAPRLSHSAAAAFAVSPGVSLRGAIGTSFRVPTFTELYYEDPYNTGNPDLQPERGWAWDLGLTTSGDIGTGALTTSLTWFTRHEQDLIDWARDEGLADEPWRVLNIASGRTRGAELEASWRLPRGHSFTIRYMRLDKDSDLQAGYVGKYSLISPRHLLVASGSAVVFRRLRLVLAGRYTERTAGSAAHEVSFVLDGRLVWDLDPWLLTVQGTNLLDRLYEEVPGVPMPGRLISLTVERAF